MESGRNSCVDELLRNLKHLQRTLPYSSKGEQVGAKDGIPVYFTSIIYKEFVQGIRSMNLFTRS